MNVIGAMLLVWMLSVPPQNVNARLDKEQITIQWQQMSDATVVHVYQISDLGLSEIDIAPSSPGYKAVTFYREKNIEYIYVISEGYLTENNEFYCIGYYEYRNLIYMTYIPTIQ